MMDTEAVKENELAVQNYVFRYPAEYPTLADIVHPEDFSWECFAWVWRAMGTIHESGRLIDVITVGDELERAGRLDTFTCPGSKQFTGRAALSLVREIRVTKGAGASYAEAVHDYACKRRITALASQMASWASNGRTAGAILSDAEKMLSELQVRSGKARSHTMGMELAVARAIDASEQAAHGQRALKTGLSDLDALIQVQKGDLVIFAARPGQGKTALLCTAILNAAKDGKNCLFFSVEMAGTQITQRLLSQLSNIPACRLISGNIHSDERDQYQEAAAQLSELPITLCDLGGITIGQVRSEARRHPGLDLLALDYIQLANADKKNDRRDLDIGEVTRGLKALAKELDVPVLAAAQLSRATEQRGDKKPILSDLRESGSIENDSDTIVFIYRKSEGTDTELDVAKHRNGPIGTAPVYWYPDTMKFTDGKVNVVYKQEYDQ